MEILSDMTKTIAESQNEMLKLMAPAGKKSTIHQNAEESDSETENTHLASISTHIN